MSVDIHKIRMPIGWQSIHITCLFSGHASSVRNYRAMNGRWNLKWSRCIVLINKYLCEAWFISF
jgi:hypothetical protein